MILREVPQQFQVPIDAAVAFDGLTFRRACRPTEVCLQRVSTCSGVMASPAATTARSYQRLPAGAVLPVQGVQPACAIQPVRPQQVVVAQHRGCFCSAGERSSPDGRAQGGQPGRRHRLVLRRAFLVTEQAFGQVQPMVARR